MAVALLAFRNPNLLQIQIRNLKLRLSIKQTRDALTGHFIDRHLLQIDCKWVLVMPMRDEVSENET